MMRISVYFLAFIVSIAAIVDAVPDEELADHVYNPKGNNLIVGSLFHGDRLCLTQNVTKSRAILRVVTEERVLSVNDFEKITRVRALDTATDGNGAVPSLTQAGPGFSNVTLQFKSQRGRDIQFVVELYCRYRCKTTESLVCQRH